MAKDRKKKQVIAEIPPELTITPELQAKIDEWCRFLLGSKRYE